MAPLSYFHRTVEWIKTCSHRPTDTFVRLILILQFFPTFNTIVLSSDVDTLQSWWLILCLVSRVSQVMEPAWRVYSGIQSCLCHLELSNKSKHTQEDEAEGVRPYQQDVSILYYVICVGTCRQDFKHLPAFMIRDKRLGDEKIHRNSWWNLLCLQTDCNWCTTHGREVNFSLQNIWNILSLSRKEKKKRSFQLFKLMQMYFFYLWEKESERSIWNQMWKQFWSRLEHGHSSSADVNECIRFIPPSSPRRLTGTSGTEVIGFLSPLML